MATQLEKMWDGERDGKAEDLGEAKVPAGAKC